MNLNKTDVLSAMQKTHDIIKEHPFRTGFGVQYISDYKNMLYTLSKDWCDYIYRCDHSPEEQSRLYQFGEWIHNFRQELRTYYKDTFPMQFFDYYEQMLQVTHIFLNTGNRRLQRPKRQENRKRKRQQQLLFNQRYRKVFQW